MTRTARPNHLEGLPLFANEEQLAAALMGPGKMAEWRQIAPLLERRGLPTVDGLLGGRYVPAVRAFFDRQYGVSDHLPKRAPHQPAELGAWKKNERRA